MVGAFEEISGQQPSILKKLCISRGNALRSVVGGAAVAVEAGPARFSCASEKAPGVSAASTFLSLNRWKADSRDVIGALRRDRVPE